MKPFAVFPFPLQTFQIAFLDVPTFLAASVYPLNISKIFFVSLSILKTLCLINNLLLFFIVSCFCFIPVKALLSFVFVSSV